MATIQTAIKIHDGMTPAMKTMIQSIHDTNRAFEALQATSRNSVDDQNMNALNTAMSHLSVTLDGVDGRIREADNAQNKFNNELRNGGSAADGLWGKIKGLVGAYAGIQGAKAIINLADSMTATTARLNLMNDGLQTTEELQNLIMKSANASRQSYLDTASAVGKLGILAKNAFGSTKEIVAFTELMNKNFVVGGADIQAQTNAMYQLTQAMASGRLQGDEFVSVMENAPLLAQAIAEYMGKSIGELRKMSAEGLITSDIIKNAMFSTADDINARLKSMPMTFAQVGTLVGNTLLKAFDPVIQTIGKGAQFIYDNWSTLEPIFYGLAAAVGAYAIGLGIMKIATIAQTIAQGGLNATMLASPITWIALAIGVLIGIIYKWVQSVGGLEIAWKICMNGILTAWDWVKIGFFTGIYWILDLWDKLKLGMMTAGTAIANFMGDMKANVLTILQNMVNGAIDIINGFISILNKIPGVNIGLIEQVTFGTTAQMENEAAKRARESDLQDYKSQIESNIADRDAKLNQMMFDARSATAQRQVEINAMQAVKAAEAVQGNDDMLGYMSDTAANTAAMKDSIDFASEDLKYLRDLSEREVIDRTVLKEVNVDMSGANYNISNEMDIDGVINQLEEKLYDSYLITAEGVHF